MRVIILPEQHAEKLTCEGYQGLPSEFLEELKSEFPAEEIKVEFSDVSFGTGADWVWLVLSLYALKEIIKEGESISKGISGWAKIGKSILKLKSKSTRMVLDADAITTLCFEAILKEMPNTEKIEKVFQNEQKNNRHSDFGVILVDSYFLMEFIVNDNYLFVFGSNANGDLEILKRVNLLVKWNEIEES